MSEAALTAATANAFLFRCSGMPDLAIGYLKESFRLAGMAAGSPPLAVPPRGSGERFYDWFDAGRDAGLETPAHAALRAACDDTSIDPPPLDGLEGLTPAAAEEDLIRAADSASHKALLVHHNKRPWAAAAGYRYSLLLNPKDRRANFNLGVHLLNHSFWDAATHHFENVLSVDPNALDALHGLHNIALKANRMAQLTPHLEALVRAVEAPTPAAPVPDAAERQFEAPIIALSSASTDAVADLLLLRGAAQVRGASKADVCAILCAQAEKWFAAFPDRLSWPLLESFPIYRDPLQILSPDLLVALRRVFGREPTLSVSDTYLRRVKPREETSYIPFHQDVTALAITGVNVWTPVMACGEDAPSLEIMAQRTFQIFPTVSSAGDYNQMEIEPAVVYAAFPPEQRFYPRAQPGDAVMFLGSTVHRSHIAPGMTRERMSLEMRFY